MPQPWERQAKESAAAYRDFVVYRDMGPDRSVPGAYRLRTGKKAAKAASGEFNKNARRWKWEERARAWDEHLQAQRDRSAAREAAKWEGRRQQTLESGWEDGLELRKVAREMLEHPRLRKKVTREERDDKGRVVVQHITIEPVKWSLSTVARFLEVASQLTASVLNATAKDPADMSNEELKAILDAAVAEPDDREG